MAKAKNRDKRKRQVNYCVKYRQGDTNGHSNRSKSYIDIHCAYDKAQWIFYKLTLSGRQAILFRQNSHLTAPVVFDDPCW